MYDKYLRGNTFSTGETLLPKHKGFLFSHSIAGGVADARFIVIDDNGNTFFMGLTFANGISILPMGVHSVVSMATGLTGLRLN